MRIGNVIRAPGGDLWIVTEINGKIVQAVAFDAENVSAGMRLDDHEEERTCPCGDCPELMGEPQEDCEQCHGRGHYTRKITGWKHSKVLAPHVKAFITRRLLKNFELE